ncbi:hypothetical protein D3C80_1644790 [compost metagenome]
MTETAEVGNERHRQGHQPLSGGPDGRAAVRVLAQPAGIAQGIPGPAQHGDHRQDEPEQLLGARFCLPGQLGTVDQIEADPHQQQCRVETGAGEAAVPCAIEAVGGQGRHHRQGADDHGRQR